MTETSELSQSIPVMMRAKNPLSIGEVKTLLKSRSNDDVISLQIVRAMYSVCDDAKKLDQALSHTQLMYHTPTKQETEEQRRFQKRMDRLRLRAEEVQYMKLTGNLDTSVADDVTTKSMTFAASVGLNMIVAPISFGVFMYFFAGAIFGWVLGEEGNVELKPHETDIKSVIAGVVSGVAMLFIEMTLFVIRTHEFDDGMRKKNKKNKVSPFGPVPVKPIKN
jgi:hypothetical protein